MVNVGDQFPSVVAHHYEPSWPTPVKLADRLRGKRSIVVGLPGAFTPT
jgi:peroxiredoxin